MDKPITVAVEEYKQAIIMMTNNFGLPAFIVAGILGDFANEARQQADFELEQDKKAWIEFQKEKTESEQESENAEE